MIQYRDGDILIAVAIPVSKSNAEGRCINSLYQIGIQLVEQVNMIIEKVNSNDDILPGVKLGTIMINSCNSDSHALKVIVLDVLRKYLISETCSYNCSKEYGSRILAGVVGGARSSVSMQLARILQVFSIPQVSYWSTSPDLSDKKLFEYFFRTVPPDIHQTLAITEFITQMKWNYISIVYDDDQYGVRGYSELLRHLKNVNVCIATAIPLDRTREYSDLNFVVEELMEKDNARVVILFVTRPYVEMIMQAAYVVPGALGKFSWIGSDRWSGLLPIDHTDDSYIESLEGAVGFKPKFSFTKGLEEHMRSLTLETYTGNRSNLNPWWPEYIRHQKNCSLESGTTHGKRPCNKDEGIPDFVTINTAIGDATYAFINSLDQYHKDVCNNKPGMCEELKQKAGTNKVASDIYRYMRNISFLTDEGRVFMFDENQDAKPIYDILYFDKNVDSTSLVKRWRNVGIYNEDGIDWTINLQSILNSTHSTCSQPCKQGQAKIAEEKICCWFCQTCNQREFVSNGTQCVECLRDEMPNRTKNGCEPIPIRKMEFRDYYTIASISIGIFGLICTMFVTFVYLKFRQTAIVRASGMELCFFVLFGIYITLLSCFTVTTTPSMISCAATRLTLSLGPACMYAGLLMKTFRVVFIFQSKGILSTRTKAYLEPMPLLLLTTCVVFVQVIIAVGWLIIHAPSSYIHYCENDGFLTCKHILDVQLFVGLAYPFVIIIICTILATINRNVPTGFRETLFVGFTMYTTCVTWIAFLPLFFTNSTDIPKKLTTISIALSVSAITVLFCLFVPRCYTMIFYPEVNTAESVMAPAGSFSTISRRHTAISTACADNRVDSVDSNGTRPRSTSVKV
ncbi:metabotropic glutamate receptor 7-like [Styela clava]